MVHSTAEAEKKGIGISHKTRIAVYPILASLDDLGVCYDLALFGSDVK